MAKRDRIPTTVDLPGYEDPIISLMKGHGIPISRENYLEIVQTDDEWGPELEATLPSFLQDFERSGNGRRIR